MEQTIIALILLLVGSVYIFRTKNRLPQSFEIGCITFTLLVSVGFLTIFKTKDWTFVFSNFYLLSFIISIMAFGLGWLILKKDLQRLSWLALIFPAILLLAKSPQDTDKITNLTYVQVAGLGAVFPLLVHFLGVMITNLSPPEETPLKTHKQQVSLLLSLAVLGFMTIVSNFVFGKEAIYLLAVGIFSTSIMFTGYNLNGQKNFPSMVILLLGWVLFTQFQENYKEEMSLGMYQLISGLLFGVSALFLSALTSSWASESKGYFTKILFIKAILGPLVFVFLSGFLFFVYEAFGGRLSLSFTLLGAVIVLPLFNQMFENRAYGGIMLIFGATLFIIPMIEHDKSDSEVVVQTDQLETNLKKLSFVNEKGETVNTNLNDLTIAQGKWVLDQENSIIEFKVLGNESVTDGFFKGFSGVLVIDENFANTYIDVEIPIVGISTFNKPRDKSIRKDEIFFNEDKFPNLKYSIRNVSIENDQYVANGEFEMKGIKAPVKTNFIFASKGTIDGKEVVVLEGNGALNRVQFGQSSDASIGDEVTFTFKTIFIIE